MLFGVVSLASCPPPLPSYELYNLAKVEPEVLKVLKARLLWHWENTVANTRWLPITTTEAISAFVDNDYHVTWWSEAHDTEVKYTKPVTVNF